MTHYVIGWNKTSSDSNRLNWIWICSFTLQLFPVYLCTALLYSSQTKEWRNKSNVAIQSKSFTVFSLLYFGRPDTCLPFIRYIFSLSFFSVKTETYFFRRQAARRNSDTEKMSAILTCQLKRTKLWRA